MNNSILHVLNGDSSKNLFPKSKIKGQIIVWREALIQGPLFYQIDSELFWEMRSQFMEKAYGAKLFEYKRKVVKEFQKIKKFQGGEIVLWFEYDSFCQINLIALISYLLRHKKNCKLSLVCVGNHPNYQKLVGLGEIKSSEYLPLFKGRTELGKQDLLLADQAWMLYCGREISKFNEISSDTFPYLGTGLEASTQLLRKAGQMSKMEIKILKLIEENEFTMKQLIGHLLKSDEILGMGDLQYEVIIKGLMNNIVTTNNILKVK